MTIGAGNGNGGAYLPFYCTPEAFNKDTPANGGDGFHYFNSIPDGFPAWTATDQMNNNNGYTETTTGIYDFLVANPEKIQEESLAPVPTPQILLTGTSISLTNVADFDIEYPNTTESSYQGTYYTEGDYRMYLYDYSNSADGQQIAGPIGINESFDNLGEGDYGVRIYEWWGNGLSPVSGMVSVDATPPTPTMTTVEPDPTNAEDFILDIAFDEDMAQATLALSDFVTGNCTVSNLTWTNGANCEITVTPGSDGDVSVDLPENSCDDLAGNGNVASYFDIESDQTIPLPELNSTEPDPTNNTSGFNIDLDFNNEINVDGVDLGDFYTENCTLSNLSGSGVNYILTATPTTEGTMVVRYEADGCTDDAGNGNDVSENLERTIDWTSPFPAMSSTAPGVVGPDAFTVDIEFTNGSGGDAEDVVGFTIDDIGTTNCTLSNFSGSGSSYTVDVVANATGTLTLTIAAAVCADDATNDNVAANDFEREADLDSPTPVMTSDEPDPTGSETFVLDIDFDEDVVDFTLGDITAVNAALSNLTGSGAAYAVDVSPIASGTTTVSVAANVCTDVPGNDNLAAEDFTIQVDYGSPASDMVSTEPDPSNADDILVDIPFNKAVVDFTFSDLVFTNATGSDFTIIDDSTYSVIMSPTADGIASIDIPEGVCTDNQGNENIADYFDRTSDRTPPQPIITTTEPDPTAAEIIPMFFDFYNETNIIGFDESDIEVSGGVLENFSGSNTTYTANIIPDWPGGLITVDIAAGTSQDATGNQSIAAETFTINSTVNIAEQNIDGFIIYPNPSNKQVTVESSSSIQKITVYDQSGQMVFQKKHTAKNRFSSETIDIQNWAVGIYLVQVVDKKGKLEIAKLIVQ